MFLWLKKLSGSMADGMWFSGRPELAPLDLDRDWPAIEALLHNEGLPHDRRDVEGWLAADGAIGLVATRGGAFAGVAVAHRVGKVAHVDLVAVEPSARKQSIARPLYFRLANAMRAGGATGFVAHARPEGGALLELLGYTRGPSYTLFEHEVGEVTVSGGHRGELVDEHEMSVDEIATLDAEVFGADRSKWLQHLFYRDDTEIYGFRKKGGLIATLCLQRTSDGGLVLRLAQGKGFADISNLIHVVLVMNSERKIRCLARDRGKLAAMLDAIEFDTPAGYVPVSEYRQGDTAGVGDGEGVLHLAWW